MHFGMTLLSHGVVPKASLQNELECEKQTLSMPVEAKKSPPGQNAAKDKLQLMTLWYNLSK
jgi:hypothetical protein